MKTTRLSDKLDFKRLGRFRISKKISSHAYRLELPKSMGIHPVFHVSLLEPCSSDPLPGQVQPPPPPTIIDNEPEWEVDEIVDSRFIGRTRKAIKYLVRWVGYGEELTWEPSELLSNAPTAIKEFHEKYPDKPRLP